MPMEDNIKVEEIIDDLGHISAEITSDKFKHGFRVVKSPGGFIFFEIKSRGGSLPKELDGKYTKFNSAIEHVKNYIDRAKETRTSRRDRVYEENHAEPQRKSG